MLIIIPIIINILAVVGFYLANKKTKFNQIEYKYKQLIIGITFGIIAIISSHLCLKIDDINVNVRDATVLLPALVFGGPAGIISGVIGALYRAISVLWGSSKYTALACSISTILCALLGAILRKYMFDNKRPTWIFSLVIAAVCEVLHMMMIFITNLNDTSSAFLFVKQCTIEFVGLNAITVGTAILVVTLISREHVRIPKGKERIAQTFQRWLVISVFLAYIITSWFTYYFQTKTNEHQIQNSFYTNMSDVINDISTKASETLISKAKEIKVEFNHNYKGNDEQLITLAQKYDVKEINIINNEGIIIRSTEDNLSPGGEHEYFDMNSTEQSRAFMSLIGKMDDSTYVQAYGSIGSDNNTMRKYAAISLDDGGFLQIGYDSTQFHNSMDKYVIDFTRNRHIGENGFIIICDENLEIVCESERSGLAITSLGITPNEEMLNKNSASKIYKGKINNINTNENEEHIYVYTFVEGYCVLACMPYEEAMLMRDASVYLAVFMEVLIFAVLFVVLYFLIKKLVIDNINKINGTLSKISSGNLNETVDVRTNVEFSSLSDDINTTVDTLKRYIKEASSRIDKELEYAKSIQQSALPNNFPPLDENDYNIYASMVPAKEVGGDFYDFYKLSDNLIAFLVADVSGKGIPAAMFMMRAKTIIKDLAERGLKVNEIFTKANEKLCVNNDSGMFVTAWMGILDLNTGHLEYANAGHNPPLIYQNNGYKYLKSRPGFVLAGLEGYSYKLNEVELKKGNRIVLYTDGVTEATNSNTELFGEERLLSFVNANLNLNIRNLLNGLKHDIDSFVDGAPQFDDITILAFEYKNGQDEEYMLEKIYKADETKLPEVLDFIEEELNKIKCNHKMIIKILVAIEEVFINVAKYAYKDSNGNIKVKFSYNDETKDTTYTIIDNGIEFNPLARPDPDVTLSALDREIGGLGIYITKKTMDKIEYNYINNENILTMTKKIEQE